MKGLFYENTKVENLRDKYIEPPFTILSSKGGEWQKRKKAWLGIGIKSEIGRNAECNPTFNSVLDENGLNKYGRKPMTGISIFDPVLCEVMYHWFCLKGGRILDPFAGGSVRGVVANYLGYKYTGIDIRPEQIESNYEQANNIFKDNHNKPEWICGDSDKVLDVIDDKFDMIFTCPPYTDLEVYSDLEGDISNMDYDDFMTAYRSIIKKSCDKLKSGGYAVFIVGEVRDKQGNYIGFIPDTINSFRDIGMNYYNEAVLETPLGTAMLRASNTMKNKKLVKVHQNILVFKKN